MILLKFHKHFLKIDYLGFYQVQFSEIVFFGHDLKPWSSEFLKENTEENKCLYNGH